MVAEAGDQVADASLSCFWGFGFGWRVEWIDLKGIIIADVGVLKGDIGFSVKISNSA